MNKNYISGIYNYCDRWCERCPFNHRCRVFADEQKLSNEEKDINSDQFWQRLSDNFAKTLEMLQKMADDMGIDLSGKDNSHDLKEANFDENGEEITISNPARKEISDRIERLSKRYHKQVDRFFDLNQDFFHGKQSDLEQHLLMDLPVDEAGLYGLQNAFQVIRWYQYFIAAKAHRSISGLELEDLDIDFEIEIQNDATGSAKITILAIRQSIVAWETVRQMFPEKTDELLDLFVLLRKAENALLEIFPKVMQFVRPGFDEPRRQSRKKLSNVHEFTEKSKN
jgi:hypothetical protein